MSGPTRTCRAAAASVVGARHLLTEAPCQDASRADVSAQRVILAVADGHGDPRHARSDEGARVAVDVAVELLDELARDLVADADRHARHVEQQLQAHLPRRLAWEWNRRVRQLAGHPRPDGTWHVDLELFGTTLLGAVFTDELAVFLRLGDGDLFTLSADGSGERVFPPDAELVGTTTWSLCQPEAARRVEVRCAPLRQVRPRLVMLCTDGVSDSLGEEVDRTLAVAEWLADRLESEGWLPVVDGLRDWLSELSERGNGDDASLALAHWDAWTPSRPEGGDEDEEQDDDAQTG